MKLVNRIPGFAKNFFFLFSIGFMFWMFFLDANNLGAQIKLSRKLDKLEKEKSFYLEKIGEVEKDRKELMSNDELLEKFARENYLMKKPDEDVYVIITQ
ncbi:MAG: FtsB family cell division protein [Cyclobacteriaceae bacterium]